MSKSFGLRQATQIAPIPTTPAPTSGFATQRERLMGRFGFSSPACEDVNAILEPFLRLEPGVAGHETVVHAYR